MLAARLASRRISCRSRVLQTVRRAAAAAAASTSAPDPLPHPVKDGSPKQYSGRVMKLVDDISSLTLIEVSDLNAALKERLNLPDMPMGMPMMGVPSAAQAPAAEDEKEPEKTSYTVKLLEFDAKKKIPLIKQIKATMEGFNLVQAKKFVEGVPQVIREDIGLEDAKSLKEKLESSGGRVEIV